MNMKEIVTLYPLNPNDKVIEKEFEVIENLELYAKNLMASQQIITAKKDCIVNVRKVKLDEVVDTRPRTEVDGKIYTFSETKRVVDEGKADNIAVINPDGEEYLLTPEKFEARYNQDKNGNWVSTGEMQKFVVVQEDIIITPTNWGGDKQTICKGGALNVTDFNDIYGITNTAFEKTYSVIKQKQQELEM